MSRRTILPYIRKIAIGLALIILMLLVKNIVESIYSTKDRSQILKQLQVERDVKKREEAYLTQKLAIAKTDQFVEEEARRKLGLVKPGEQIVVDEKLEPKKPEIVPEEVPNWKKWTNLFLREI